MKGIEAVNTQEREVHDGDISQQNKFKIYT